MCLHAKTVVGTSTVWLLGSPGIKRGGQWDFPSQGCGIAEEIPR